MTIIAIILLLATFAFCAAMHQRCRANNLALQVDGLRDEIDILAKKLIEQQDAARQAKSELKRKAALIAQYDTQRDILMASRWGNMGARSWARRNRKRALVSWHVATLKGRAA